MASLFFCIVSSAVSGDSHWKTQNSTATELPWWLRYLFSNGFRNPLGVASILGTFYFPCALYLAQHGIIYGQVAVWSCVVMGACRLLALAAEVWFVSQFFRQLLSAPPPKQS